MYENISTFANDFRIYCGMDVKKNSLKAWLLASRPKTLTGAAVPVMIGLALAYVDGRALFCWQSAALCVLFAFLMQIDANLVNDLYDYLKGTDTRETRLGPERACTQGWVSVGRMKAAIALTTFLSCCAGLPLAWYGGWEMVLVGVACVVFCFLYTTYFSYKGLGDVLVLLFFGLVPVTVTYYIQLHTVSVEVVVASIACGLVIDGLLFVNNFRDRDTDRLSGKMTIVVRIGARASLACYCGLGIVACAMGVVFWLNGHLWATLLPLFYLLLHLLTAMKMKRIWHGRDLNRCLGETARNIFVYGVCVVVGLLLCSQ